MLVTDFSKLRLSERERDNDVQHLVSVDRRLQCEAGKKNQEEEEGEETVLVE